MPTPPERFTPSPIQEAEEAGFSSNTFSDNFAERLYLDDPRGRAASYSSDRSGSSADIYRTQGLRLPEARTRTYGDRESLSSKGSRHHRDQRNKRDSNSPPSDDSGRSKSSSDKLSSKGYQSSDSRKSKDSKKSGDSKRSKTTDKSSGTKFSGPLSQPVETPRSNRFRDVSVPSNYSPLEGIYASQPERNPLNRSDTMDSADDPTVQASRYPRPEERTNPTSTLGGHPEYLSENPLQKGDKYTVDTPLGDVTATAGRWPSVAGQPYMRSGGYETYKAQSDVFERGDNRRQENLAGALLSAIELWDSKRWDRNSTDIPSKYVNKLTPEEKKAGKAFLANMVAENVKKRTPGSIELAKAQLQLIKDGTRTFQEAFGDNKKASFDAAISQKAVKDDKTINDKRGGAQRMRDINRDGGPVDPAAGLMMQDMTGAKFTDLVEYDEPSYNPGLSSMETRSSTLDGGTYTSAYSDTRTRHSPYNGQFASLYSSGGRRFGSVNVGGHMVSMDTVEQGNYDDATEQGSYDTGLPSIYSDQQGNQYLYDDHYQSYYRLDDPHRSTPYYSDGNDFYRLDENQ
jgi:hypothetical protein